jgi:hypothetical protein
MNEEQHTSPENPSPRLRWIHRVWGALPTVAVFLLIGVVVLLFNHIRTEGEVIKERQASELRTARPRTNVVAWKWFRTGSGSASICPVWSNRGCRSRSSPK